MSSITFSTRRLTSALTAGAFALLSLAAQAQVASTSYGAQRSSSAASNPAQVGARNGIAAAPAANNPAAYGRVNSLTPNGRANTANNSANSYGHTYTGGSALTTFGYSDFGGYGSYAGQPFNSNAFGGNAFGSYGSYNGNGFSNGTGGTLSGGNITVVGSPYYGGFATLGPSGTYSFGQTSGYSPYGDPSSGLYDPTYTGVTRSVAGASVSGSSAPPAPVQPATPSLAQSLVVRRGQNYDLSIGWRGDPALISGLKVTLLDRFHLPVGQQSAQTRSAAYFPANKDTYAARYYRVDVQYADGAVASLTASLPR